MSAGQDRASSTSVISSPRTRTGVAAGFNVRISSSLRRAGEVTQQSLPANGGNSFPPLPQLQLSSTSGSVASGSVASGSRSGSSSNSSAALVARRRRHSGGPTMKLDMRSLVASGKKALPASPVSCKSGRKNVNDSSTALAKARARSAQKVNDSMVYLDGPQVYTCAQCRTHLTSHDDIISKSFHGRHGRAYLFDQCVNVTIGPAEDRLLITGLHSVCDIFCKRCKNMVGWTYAKAYEASQKYKEGKYIIEKINLHLEESDYDVEPPAGERLDRWRRRSMSWGTDRRRDYRERQWNESCPTVSLTSAPMSPMSPRGSSTSFIYEYRPSSP